MKSLSKFSKKAQRGYSLIELSIALAIVGVVIAGSIVGVQAILRSNNVNKTISQTNTAVNKIVGKMVRDVNYSNVTLKNLTAKGVEVWADADIASGGTDTAQVTHPLSGRVYVAPLSASTEWVQANLGYVYTLAGVPVAACADLAVGLEGLAYVLSILNEDATTGSQTRFPYGTPQGTIIKDPSKKYDSVAANSACSTGASGGTATDQATISFLVPRR